LIIIIEDDEEEKKHGHTNQLAEELAEMIPKPAQKALPAKKRMNKLCALETETLSTTKKLGLKWDHSNDKVISWKILANRKHINKDPIDIPNSAWSMYQLLETVS
jgi:hypothetical protein